MNTKRLWIGGCLAVMLATASCAGDPADGPPDVDSLVQRLNNDPNGVRLKDATRHPAELSPDGKNYCAKEDPKLCAPATAARRGREGACRCVDDDTHDNIPPWCTCCLWVPGSWPFEIECGRPWDFP